MKSEINWNKFISRYKKKCFLELSEVWFFWIFPKFFYQNRSFKCLQPLKFVKKSKTTPTFSTPLGIKMFLLLKASCEKLFRHKKFYKIATNDSFFTLFENFLRWCFSRVARHMKNSYTRATRQIFTQAIKHKTNYAMKVYFLSCSYFHRITRQTRARSKAMNAGALKA